MTKSRTADKAISDKSSSKASRFGRICLCFALTLIFFRSSSVASLWVSRGLALCAQTLIPSIFPFMVLSSFLTSINDTDNPSTPQKTPFSLLFGLRGSCAQAILFGWLCGFPIGAVCADSLHKSGRISLEEQMRVLCVCGVPSPAFLIGAVGRSMLGSPKLGIALYAISIASSIIIGIFLKVVFGPPKHSEDVSQHSSKEKSALSFALTESISSSALGAIRVCAFVVFFCAVIGILGEYLSQLGISEKASSLIFSFFELTFGLSELSALSEGIRFPLCALAVGWSGTSVHLQTMSIIGKREKKISFKLYFLAHLLRSLLCFSLGSLANAFLL